MKKILLLTMIAFVSLPLLATENEWDSYLGKYIKQDGKEECVARVTCTIDGTCDVKLSAKVEGKYDITVEISGPIKEVNEEGLYIKKKEDKYFGSGKLKNRYKVISKAKIYKNEDGTYDFSLSEKKYDLLPLPRISWNKNSCNGMDLI